MVEMPDPVLASPIAQRVAFRGGTGTSIDDFTDPPFFIYPTNQYFTSIIRPAFTFHALVE
jgi:hypothetical protein